MRISEIRVFSKELPIVGGPYVFSTATLHAIDTTIVRVETESGLVGWGEFAPVGSTYQPQHALGARAAIGEMAPGLIGQSVLSPLVLRRRMDALLNGHGYAKAALEIAALDLLGKHHGVRMCDLLGGAEAERLPAYYAVGSGAPEETADRAAAKVAEGYRRIQIKAGGRAVAIDVAVARKVWERIGWSAQIVVDANRALTASEALRFSLACRDIPFVLEQPCNTMEEIAAIRGQLAHPVHLDENTESVSDVLRAIAMGVCDGFGLKVTRLGGPGAMTTARDICAARSLPHTVEDSWGGDIVAAATLHVAATVEPRLLESVWTAGDYIAESYDPERGIRVEGGRFVLPEGPGLGVTPAEDRIGALVATYG